MFIPLFLRLLICYCLFKEAKKDNEREREVIEKNRKAKLAKEKAEKERKEREARKRALIDMNPSETQEGVMDRYKFTIFLYRLLSFIAFGYSLPFVTQYQYVL